jgi:hypothetical protein
MNDNDLKRLRQEARNKEVERKVEAFGREQIEKEIMKHVQLTIVIYVELLASCAPTT